MSTIPKNISFSVDLTKIDKSLIQTDEKGRKWLRMRMVNTPDSQYGKDYMVTHDVPKEIRETGRQFPILGNAVAYDTTEGRKATDPQSVTASAPSGDDDLPF